ncbi:hypothetical protein NLY44_28040 [Mesorhizobium sp. C089B]|uniref:hypothetical protein n=1 Tax=Mesorhizobium sp. C089B TaxID=2956823 RepID=UPI002575600A|nr:hypothetical protein [Mesorhizobium sp. C089B]WJI50367.1 hypothetical protein NLY44_28040 [Mesorhizobium sp. C089B]
MQHIMERLVAKLTQFDIDPLLLLDTSRMELPSIPHRDAMVPPGLGPTEITTRLQKPKDRLLWADMRDTQDKMQIKASDIHNMLDMFGDSVKVLSLDCFDTLLWRKTATPEDVFVVLADNPVARSLGITPHQRISAASRASRAKRLENGSKQIDIRDIYRFFTSLSGEERELLAETEIRTEINVCFAFLPYVDLIRRAHSRGLKIIIVSDTYLREEELRRLLAQHLPSDVMRVISKVYCSVEYGTSKSEALLRL